MPVFPIGFNQIPETAHMVAMAVREAMASISPVGHAQGLRVWSAPGIRVTEKSNSIVHVLLAYRRSNVLPKRSSVPRGPIS